MGYDGVDINMGCPDRSIVSKGACSALINNPELAKEIIEATQEGLAGEAPLSVKIRIGFDKIQTEDWVEFLLKLGLDALIVHGRTTKELSKVPSRWEEIGKAVKIRDKMGIKTKIIGNGDIKNLTQAYDQVEKFGVDGVMIGRGIFSDPWVFNLETSIAEKSVAEKLSLLRSHAHLFEEVWGREKHFDTLKRFIKIYVSGFEGAFEMRLELMSARTTAELGMMVEKYFNHYKLTYI